MELSNSSRSALFSSSFLLHSADVAPGTNKQRENVTRAILGPLNVGRVLTECLSALLKEGLSEEAVIKAIEQQFAEPKTSKVVHASFVHAVAALMDVPCSLANNVDYHSDIRAPNMAWLADQTTEVREIYAPGLFLPSDKGVTSAQFKWVARDDKGARMYIPVSLGLYRASAFGRHLQQMKRPFMHCYEKGMPSIHRLSCPLADRHGFAEGPAESTPPVVRSLAERSFVMGEYWQSVVLSGGSSAEDCENVAMAIVRELDALRQQLAFHGAPLPPLLGAFRKVLDLYVPYMVGGTVAEPYMKTALGKGEKAPPHIPLPTVGSEEDLKWPSGGHGFGYMETAVQSAKRFLAGIKATTWKDKREQMISFLHGIVKQASAWMMELPRMILEGTGPVYRLLMAPDRTFANMEGGSRMEKQMTTRIHFCRDVKNRADPDLAVLADFVRIASVPYEEISQGDDVRISGFYHGASHLLSARIYREWSPLLSQVLVVNLLTGQRTPTMNDFLPTDKKDVVGYVSIYGQHLTLAEWKSRVEPVTHRALRLLPDYDSERTHGPRQERAQVLPTSTTSALHELGLGEITLQARLASLPEVPTLGEGERTATARCMRASLSEDSVVVAMTVPDWQFAAQGPEKSLALVGALERLKSSGKIKDYVMMRDHPLARGSHLLQILVCLPVHS